MNKYGCGPGALSIVIGIPVEQIYEDLGHDGSAIMFPELPEPINRRGFHPQELTDVALKYGYTMTEIQACPVSTTDGIHTFDVYTDYESRMRRYIDNNQGIFVGPRIHSRKWHYVAWVEGRIHDPAGPVLPFERCPIDIVSFFMISNSKTQYLKTQLRI